MLTIRLSSIGSDQRYGMAGSRFMVLAAPLMAAVACVAFGQGDEHEFLSHAYAQVACQKKIAISLEPKVTP